MNMKLLPGGWIYVLFSSADYTRCKIGKTDGNPLKRFKNLRTGDPCLALHVAYYIPAHFGPTSKIESSIHCDLKDYRINNHEDSYSEWFRISMEQAEGEIDRMLEEWLCEEISGPSKIHLEVLTKMYESGIQDFFEPDQYEREFAAEIFGNSYSQHD
jgi:hypothetical protein